MSSSLQNENSRIFKDSSMKGKSKENFDDPLNQRLFELLHPVTPEELEQRKKDWSTIDPYCDEETELKFLHQKPACFLITGKPGVGKTTLAKKLANEWKCELVNVTDLINQHLDQQTEEGGKLLEILNSGKCVSEELVTKLLNEKLHSPEVAHYGYVLDGYPCLDEEYQTVNQQMATIKNLKMKPDFIIHLTINDDDLQLRRNGQRFDPDDGTIYVRANYAPEPDPVLLKDVPLPEPAKVKGKTDEEEEEEEEPEEIEEEEEMDEDEDGNLRTTRKGGDPDFPLLRPEVVERLLRRPEDMAEAVEEHLKAYSGRLERHIDDLIAQHDQQMVIRLDGNRKPTDLCHQILNKLKSFHIRPAVVPLRLYNLQEEEEAPEDLEADELMRMLGTRQNPAPRFRWQRSKWMKYCPVALYDGKLIVGKPENAVAFLDKIYVMSTAEAMLKFLKNPRPYLLPPQPRIPCKLAILGPKHSGKTTLCHLLAQQYGAKILNMDELIRPRVEAEREALLQQVHREALEVALATVKTKLREEAENAKQAEINARNAFFTKKEDTEEVEEEATPEDEEKGDVKGPEDGAEDAAATIKDEDEIPEPVVEEHHPEVQELVEKAVEEARKMEIKISPEVYLEVLEQAVYEVEKTLAHANPRGPSHGRWILDNFPNNRDQCMALLESGVEKGLVPDEVIYLKDESEGGELLLRRWYRINRDAVDASREQRLAVEEAERRRRDELERKRLEDDKRLREKSDAGEKGDDEPEKDNEVEEELMDEKSDLKASDLLKEASDKKLKEGTDLDDEGGAGPAVHFQEDSKSKEDPLPPPGPETEAAKAERREYDNEWATIHGVLTGNTPIEPFEVVINSKTEEDIFNAVKTHLDKAFQLKAWMMTGVDIEEEDDDNEAAKAEEEANEEEAEEEEEGDPNRGKEKRLGDTNYFCPVALKEQGVLLPGNPEIAAKYKNKIYYIYSEEDREKFLENPEFYLSHDGPPRPPPLRLLILGAKGSGKTFHGKYLAEKFGVFHVSFHERLQELIMSKTRKKIGPEYVEEEETPLEDVSESEDDEHKPPSGQDDNKTPEPKVTENVEPEPSSIVGNQNSNDQSDELGEEEKIEEEATQEMNEIETAIKDNLENQDPLSHDILEQILGDLWKKAPFKDCGFVLEGFPRTPEEVNFLSEKGLFVDAAIILNAEDSDVIGRLLPPKLEKWREKRNLRNMKKAEIKEKKRKKRERRMERRKKELLKERDERRKERLAEKQAAKAAKAEEDEDGEEEEVEEEEEEEEEEGDNIDELLAEEFEEEPEEEEEEEETEEDAVDRMTQEINEMYDNDINALTTVLDTMEELMIPKIDVSSGKKPTLIRYQLLKALKQYTENREAMFERCYSLKDKVADKLLRAGYVQPSRFGTWCPVQLKSGHCFQHLQDADHATYNVLYRSHLYILSSLEAKEQFMLNPLNYLRQPNPKPVVPVRLAIIGPPKCGKTTLCRRISKELGLFHTSIGQAIRQQLKAQPRSCLSRDIYSYLVKGLTVPDELAVQALERALMDTVCSTRGYVLDGYPFTIRQVQLMTERNIIPFRVIELTCDKQELMVRNLSERQAHMATYPDLLLHDSPQILAIRLAAYDRAIPDVRQWYQREHRNYHSLDAQQSKWWLWEKTYDMLKQQTRHIQDYWDGVYKGKAASLADVCIIPKQFQARLGHYGQYCPVRLQKYGELVDCSQRATTENGALCLKYAAEYGGHYYMMEGEAELRDFLAHPENFFPPKALRQMPRKEALPRRMDVGPDGEKLRLSFPVQMEMKGYCPVTFLEGKCRYEALKLGKKHLLVQYMDRVYSFFDEQCLDKFMRKPERYRDLKLPHKLPPLQQPLDVRNLPLPGFLEQTVADALRSSLTAVGNYKPKFPFLSQSRSALLYVALHLKAFNPHNPDYLRKKYRRKLEEFEEQCELIKYLGEHMTLKYKEISARPVGFDRKMDIFLKFKTMPDTPERWVSSAPLRPGSSGSNS